MRTYQAVGLLLSSLCLRFLYALLIRPDAQTKQGKNEQCKQGYSEFSAVHRAVFLR